VDQADLRLAVLVGAEGDGHDYSYHVPPGLAAGLSRPLD
jgi:hypothetical protein